MKSKLIALLSVMVILSVIGVIIINIVIPVMGREKSSEDKLQIVATFYPIYMIGMNMADQAENIEINSLTELNTGCLHDYQLTTADMKLISQADILIINGAGMEGFLEDVIANYPQLTIIDATDNITLLPNEEGAEGEYNSHVWLDPKRYIQQIENVRDGLIEYLKQKQEASSDLIETININSQNYIKKVSILDQETGQIDMKERQSVIFHESFAYLAERIGMKVAFSVPLDSDTALSAGDIAEIINKVKQDNIKYLFTEEQYSDSIAKRIEAETGAKVYIIDSAVTGDGTKDSYLNSMQSNIDMLSQAQ